MASHVETVLRSADLLNIQIEFVNLTVDVAADGTPRLNRIAGQTPTIVIRLPAQHVAEQVFDSNVSRQLPYVSLLSSPSRLAFDIPAAMPLPAFTVEDILRCVSGLSPRPPGSVLGADPATVIELPYRVLLSPAPNTRLLHRATPLPGSAATV